MKIVPSGQSNWGRKGEILFQLNAGLSGSIERGYKESDLLYFATVARDAMLTEGVGAWVFAPNGAFPQSARD